MTSAPVLLAISKELVAKLVAWRHPGFSAHVGERIAPEDKLRLEDTAAYLVRNPLSFKKLIYLDAQQADIYRSKLNPFLERDFEAMHPVEGLARMSDHIPDPGQHRSGVSAIAKDAVLELLSQRLCRGTWGFP
jgi:hypothetical protein